MMTKTEHIDYWIRSSEEDWETVTSLYTTGRYIHCLFFGHLALKKLCKALWVKNNESNIPPKIHNLVRLLQDSNQDFNDENFIFLEEFNDFQLEGRYPDYLFIIKNICTFEYTTTILNKVKEIKQCLIEKL